MRKLLLLPVLAALLSCNGLHRDMVSAELMRADDMRDAAGLRHAVRRIRTTDLELAREAALVSGRIPDLLSWQQLADRFSDDTEIVTALAAATRFPDTGFPTETVRDTLQELPLTGESIIALLSLNDIEALNFVLGQQAFASVTAANLWRAGETVTEDMLRDAWDHHPEEAVYSIYRLKQEGIITADELAAMPVFQRFYGCGLSDDPGRFLTDEDWRVRIAALKAVPERENAQLLLEDPNPLVRTEALATFGTTDGGLWRIDLESVTPMGAERLLAARQDDRLAVDLFERGGLYSMVAAPDMPVYRETDVLAAPVPDSRKLAFLEKTAGEERALTYARDRFEKEQSPGALQYLMGKLPDGEKAPFLEQAMEAGGMLRSIVDDMQPAPVTADGQPLITYIRKQRLADTLQGFTVVTDKGEIRCRFFPEAAPRTVLNFAKLADAGYFDNVPVHRVVPAFVTQDGDPSRTGSGGPGWTIRCEYNLLNYDKAGVVGMALAGKDTGGSQYFLTHLPTPHLNRNYTIFAEMTDGMDVLARLEQYDVIRQVRLDPENH